MKKNIIIILSYNHNATATKLLVQEIEKKGYKARVLNPQKLHLYLSDRNAWDLIYDNYNKKTERLRTGNIKAIIPRVGADLKYSTFIVEQLNYNVGIYTPQTANAILNANDKMKTLQKCSSKGIRVPKTIFVKNNIDIDFVVAKLGLPFICKTVTGSLGAGVSVLPNKMTANSVLQTLLKDKKALILQEFVGDGTDIRAIVIGNKVVAAQERKSNKRNEFRANLSLGGTAKAIKLSKEVEEFCVKAAHTVGLSIAGVDIMTDNNKTVLIEVNANFGFKIQKVTGINIAKLMVDYVINQSETFTLKTKKKPLLENNEYINELFLKTKGQNVSYTNRNKENKEILIKNVSDIYKIMIDTFEIK